MAGSNGLFNKIFKHRGARKTLLLSAFSGQIERNNAII